MDGFTGVNEKKLHNDLDNLLSSICDIYNNINKANQQFSKTLKEKWGSPEAVSKTTRWSNELASLVTNIYDTGYSVIETVENKASSIAKAIGGDYNKHFLGMGAPGLTSGFEICNDNINGAVAMDTKSIESALINYALIFNQTLSSFDKVPKSINLYSSDGSIIESYSTHIDSYKMYFEDEIKAISSEIKICIESYLVNTKASEKDTVATFSRAIGQGVGPED